MKKKTKKTHGGFREGAGAKSKYGEPTVNMTIRVPESKRDAVRKIVADFLEQFVVPKSINEEEFKQELFNWPVDTMFLFNTGGFVDITFENPVIFSNDEFKFFEGNQPIKCRIIPLDKPHFRKYRIIKKAGQ